MLSLVCLVIAFVLFLLASFSIPSGRINFIAAGLAAWILPYVVQAFGK